MNMQEKMELIRKIRQATDLDDLKEVLITMIIATRTDLDDNMLEELGNIANEK